MTDLPAALVVDLSDEVNVFVMAMQKDDLVFYDLDRCLKGAVWAWGNPKRIAGVADAMVDDYRVHCDEMTGGQGETQPRLDLAHATVRSLCCNVWHKLSSAGCPPQCESIDLDNGYDRAPYTLVRIDDYFRVLLARSD